MESVVKTIESIYESTKKLNAGEGHFEIGGAFHDDKATVVLSVYVDQKPSNKVLNELWDWAEENQNEDLMNKIKTLSEL